MCGSTLGEVVVVFPVVYAPGNGRVREVLYRTPPVPAVRPAKSFAFLQPVSFFTI